MALENLEEVERIAASIREHLQPTIDFAKFMAAGGDITDPYDTFPHELYEAASRPEAMKVILDAVDQIRLLQTRNEATVKVNKDLINELRIANEKHQAAMRWAMNNANTLKSHLDVCRHDDVKGLEVQVASEQNGRAHWKATAMMAGQKLLKRKR